MRKSRLLLSTQHPRRNGDHIFPELREGPRDPVAVRARQAIEEMIERLEWRYLDTVGLLLRLMSVFAFFVVVVLQYLFDELGAPAKLVLVWLVCYAGSLGLLEYSRRRWADYYNAWWLRLARVSLYGILFTWLMASAEHGRVVIWSFLLIPLFGSINYFHRGLWPTVAWLVSIGCLYAGGYLFPSHPLTPGQLVGLGCVLGITSLVFWLLCKSALQSSSRLNEIARELNATLDLEVLVVQLVAAAKKLSGADRALVVAIEPTDGTYLTHASDGFYLEAGRSWADFVQKCKVTQTGELFESADLRAEYGHNSIYKRFFGCDPRAVIAVPVFNSAMRMTALIAVTHQEADHFDAVARRAILDLTQRASRALENSLQVRESQVEMRNQSIADQFDEAESEEELQRVVLGQALRLVPPAHLAVYYYLNASGDLEKGPEVKAELNPDNFLNYQASWSDLDTEWLLELLVSAAEERQRFVVKNTRELLGKQFENAGFASILLAPVNCFSEPAGAVVLLSAQPFAFHREYSKTVATLCELASEAMTRLRQFAAFRAQGGLIKQIFDEVHKFDSLQNESELCHSIVGSATSVLGFKRARLWIVDQKTNEWVTTVTSGIPALAACSIEGYRASVGAFDLLLTAEFQIERSYFIPQSSDVWNNVNLECFYSRTLPAAPICKRHIWNLNDALLTPIRSQAGHTIGLLSLDAPTSGRLPRAHVIEAIGVFSSAAAWAIENFRTEEQLRQQRARTEAVLASINTELMNCKDVNAVGNVVVNIARTLFPAEKCCLHLWRDGRLVLTHSSSLGDANGEPIDKTANCILPMIVAKSGEPAQCKGGLQAIHPGCNVTTEECRPMLVVPVRSANGDILGVLTLENKSSGQPFDDEDELQLARLAIQITEAIRAMPRIEAIEKWERKGLEDDLHDLISWHHAGVYSGLECLKQYLDAGEMIEAYEFLPLLICRAKSTVSELKTIHTAFISQYLEIEDLAAALRKMADVWATLRGRNLQIDVNCPDGLRMPNFLQGKLLRIACIGLTNAIVHSGVLDDNSIDVGIDVTQINGRWRLQVSDSGRGSAEITPGYGISRARALLKQLRQFGYSCSDLTIHSALGSGTRLSVDFFVEAHNGTQTSLAC